MSIRLTKKLATDAVSARLPPSAARRSSPRRYASITRRYISSEKISVTLMLRPSAIICSIAGIPSAVAGIFTMRFGRPISDDHRRASSIVPGVSWASSGDTSTET